MSLSKIMKKYPLCAKTIAAFEKKKHNDSLMKALNDWIDEREYMHLNYLEHQTLREFLETFKLNDKL